MYRSRPRSKLIAEAKQESTLQAPKRRQNKPSSIIKNKLQFEENKYPTQYFLNLIQLQSMSNSMCQ